MEAGTAAVGDTLTATARFYYVNYGVVRTCPPLHGGHHTAERTASECVRGQRSGPDWTDPSLGQRSELDHNTKPATGAAYHEEPVFGNHPSTQLPSKGRCHLCNPPAHYLGE